MNLQRLRTPVLVGIGNSVWSGGTRTATALDSAYVHQTSGDAVAIRYVVQNAGAINEAYIFLDDVAGTLGNITMEAAIYNENTSYNSRPGATSRDTSTACAMPDAADKWIKFTFGTPYTPAVGEILWLVFYNTAASPGTDYPSILTGTTVDMAIPPSHLMGHTTTNGFSGNGSQAYEIPCVIKHGTDVYVGLPWTQHSISYYTSGTLERGIVVTPTKDITVVGARFYPTTAYSDLRILAAATAPGGTAIATYDLDSDTDQTTADNCGAKWFATPVTLAANTTYKVTLTFAANSQVPNVMQIEDYASYSAVFDALRAEDQMFTPWSAIDDGAGGWTVDKSIAPWVNLLIGDFPLQHHGPRFGDRTGGLR